MANRYVAFGYEITDGKYAVIEYEKKIVENVFGLYVNGKSFNDIATRMNEAGVSYNNDGRCWNKNMVKRMIENRRYIGENGFPQIIATDTFNIAEKLRLSKFTPPTAEEKAILDFYHDRLVCGECGSRLQRYKGSKNRKGETHNYRRCMNEECIGNKAPINEKKLNMMVAETINELIERYDEIHGVNSEKSEIGIEVMRLENELADEMTKITVDISLIVEKITELAETRFENAVGYDYTAIDEKIKKALSIHPKTERLDGELLHSIVKKIKYTPSKTIEMELINGYKISGGE